MPCIGTCTSFGWCPRARCAPSRPAKVIVLDVRRKARLESARPERQPPRDAA